MCAADAAGMGSTLMLIVLICVVVSCIYSPPVCCGGEPPRDKDDDQDAQMARQMKGVRNSGAAVAPEAITDATAQNSKPYGDGACQLTSEMVATIANEEAAQDELEYSNNLVQRLTIEPNVNSCGSTDRPPLILSQSHRSRRLSPAVTRMALVG